MEAFICPACDAPIPYDDAYTCGGCHTHWCIPCDNKGLAESFSYRDNDCCTFCFPTGPVRIRDTDLLNFALEELGVTKAVLEYNMREVGPVQFRSDFKVHLECTVCPIGECASKECLSVNLNQLSPRYEYETVKGFCCNAVEKLEPCIGCQRWQNRRLAITLIGVRRFRKTSLLALLPRDVLNTCIIKQFCWHY